MKQIGLSLRMYASESVGELYPRAGFYYQPLVDCDSVTFSVVGEDLGVYTNSFYFPDVYPEYIPDANVLVCPSDDDPGWESMDSLDMGNFEVGQLCSQDGRGVTEADGSYTYLSYGFNTYLTYGFNGVGEDENDPVIDIDAADGLRELMSSDGTVDEILAQLGLYAGIVYDLKERDPERLFEVLGGDIDFAKIGSLAESSDSALLEELDNKSMDTLYRLREGITRFWITDINFAGTRTPPMTAIPVMFDNVAVVPTDYHHIPGGANVLYFDGHVSFVRHEDRFPVTESFARVIRGMDR